MSESPLLDQSRTGLARRAGLSGAAAHPFTLDLGEASGWRRLAFGLVTPAIERVSGLRALGRVYDEAMGSAIVEDFPERALDHLGIRWEATGAVADIPAEGPLVIVANHPFGAVDGLVLLALVRRVRRDVRLLGNYLLNRIPELRPVVLEVDPFARAGSHAMNAKMVRRAVHWTKRGGALIVFPAGEVASVAAPDGRLIDPAWRHGAARIIAQSGATVVTAGFEGRNSRLFALAGRVHPLLRTVLLPRELLRMRGARVRLDVGPPIPASRLARLDGPAAVMSYLRARTYARVPKAASRPRASRCPATERIADALPRETLVAEVAALGPDRHLAEIGAFTVFHASADEVPSVVQEIGRLREIAFRAAGEGTGRSRDLDRFDRHYQHLVAWHRERQEIVGAYRFAVTADTTAARGARGLYTRTLFRFGRQFLTALGPAMELGRSFVRIEYQREHAPLLLLWQGIGQWLARHPECRRMIGPVSISAAYSAVSRDALINALEHPSLRSPLAPLVRPRRPYRRHSAPTGALSVKEAGALLKEIEPAGLGLPVLVRQYLKLNARTVATNIDPDFANVVDALMVVDLADVPKASLERYR